jgi:hypothetical protein
MIGRACPGKAQTRAVRRKEQRLPVGLKRRNRLAEGIFRQVQYGELSSSRTSTFTGDARNRERWILKSRSRILACAFSGRVAVFAPPTGLARSSLPARRLALCITVAVASSSCFWPVVRRKERGNATIGDRALISLRAQPVWRPVDRLQSWEDNPATANLATGKVKRTAVSDELVSSQMRPP